MDRWTDGPTVGTIALVTFRVNETKKLSEMTLEKKSTHITAFHTPLLQRATKSSVIIGFLFNQRAWGKMKDGMAKRICEENFPRARCLHIEAKRLSIVDHSRGIRLLLRA